LAIGLGYSLAFHLQATGDPSTPEEQIPMPNICHDLIISLLKVV
jgi:hypothetical protein